MKNMSKSSYIFMTADLFVSMMSVQVPRLCKHSCSLCSCYIDIHKAEIGLSSVLLYNSLNYSTTCLLLYLGAWKWFLYIN